MLHHISALHPGTRPAVHQLLFEAVSAYSTAGLSTGITAQLCLAAKLVLIFTMYTGRVGAFTLLSLWVERPEPNAHFTEEAITIG